MTPHVYCAPNMNHLLTYFFNCCVALKVWDDLCSEILSTSIGVNFESIARWWISGKKT
jgi:hypothetical protein